MTVASTLSSGYNAAYGPHCFSALSITGIVLAHLGVLALLASIDVIPVPVPLATLMVRVIPTPVPLAPAVEPEPVVKEPEPRPVEDNPIQKPVARKPAPVPSPVLQPRILSTQTEAMTPAAEAPAIEAAPPSPEPPPPPEAVSEPRFDADYLSNPAPIYPAMSRRLREEGTVLLRVFVESNGLPSQIEVKTGSGSRRLDQAAEAAVWRWKFIPARQAEVTVGAWVQVPLIFSLKG